MDDRSRYTRLVPYIVVGGAAGYLYYVAAHFEFHARAHTLGPDFWPQAILALIIATCICKIVAGLATRGDAPEAGGVLEEIVADSAQKHALEMPAAAPAAEHHPFLLMAGIALTAGYVVFIQRLGFFVATVLYLALFVVLGGYRRWSVVAAVSVVGTLLLLFFFMKVVYVSLPIGQEPYSAVTLFLMRVMGIR